MEETIDLKKYVTEKQKEKDAEALKKIGEALSGLPIKSVINILAVVTKDVMKNFNSFDRHINCKVFYDMISGKLGGENDENNSDRPTPAA